MPVDEYGAYLRRFEQRVGKVNVGGYGKWNGKLVRKLAPDEWSKKQVEFQTLSDTYQQILERGDTINNSVIKLLRERALELLVDFEAPAV